MLFVAGGILLRIAATALAFVERPLKRHDAYPSYYNLFMLCRLFRSRGCSGSIVSNYWLDYRAIGIRSPAEVKAFSSILCVQTGSEAPPASFTMGTGGPFPGAKRGRGVTLTTHPHLVPRSRMSRSYTSSPPSATMACSGTAFVVYLTTPVQ
jgi:hypothetical protein